jgi:hypothetical protein
VHAVQRFAIVSMTVLILAGAAAADAQPDDPNDLTVFGGLSLVDAETTEPRLPNVLEVPRRFSTLIFPAPIFTRFRSLDASGEFGVRYGRDLTDTVTFAGDFAIAPAHDLTDETSFSCPDPIVCIAVPAALIAPNVRFIEPVVAYHYGGGLQLNLRRRGLMPSVIAGIGGVTYAVPGRARTHFAFRVGGRIAAPIGPLTASIEVLDAMITDHFVTDRLEHDVHTRVGIGVRF